MAAVFRDLEFVNCVLRFYTPTQCKQDPYETAESQIRSLATMTYQSIRAHAKIGTVRVAISAFEFDPQAMKEDPKSINRLVEAYGKANNDCGRANERSYLTGLLDYREWDVLLKANPQLRGRSLRAQNARGQIPTLHMQRSKIRCLNGQQLVRAAEAFFDHNHQMSREEREQQKWWFVHLYRFKAGRSLSSLLLLPA